MSQSYIELDGDTTLTASRAILNNNADALKTDFSGTTAPFSASESTLGATYYNTNDKKMYRVVAVGNTYQWRVEADNVTTADIGTINTVITNNEFVTKSVNKSNCITAIPQNIKIEVNGTTITAKSGSILTRPNGDQYQLTEDISSGFNTNGTYYIMYRIGSTVLLNWWPVNEFGSGSSLPADGTTYTKFFNTTDLNFYLWNSGSNSWQSWYPSGSCMPLGIVTVNNGVVTLDNVFNGAGYVGHHAFVLPGVKALIPDGFNSDGTLKSYNVTTTALQIVEMVTTPGRVIGFQGAANVGSLPYAEVKTKLELQQQFIYQYCQETNTTWLWQNNAWSQNTRRCCFVYYNYNGTTVTQFDVRPVVRMASQEQINSLQNSLDTLDAQNVKLTGSQTIAGNKTLTGYTTFSSTVNLGSDAHATTPATNNNDTLVATTAWGNNFLNGMRTNCITYIPQDIKLELDNGTLTLKSGSVVTAPDGTQVTITSDKTHTYTSSSGQRFIYYSLANNSLQSSWVSATGSGPSLPADGSTYTVFFNSADSKFYVWNAGSSSWNVANNSLPIAIVTIADSNIKSIDQVFNGFGYIGSTIFVLPGVKGLAANGRNNDGTLKSSSVNVASLLIRTVSSAQNTKEMAFISSGIALNTFSYNEEANYLYDANNTQRANTIVVGPVEFSQSSPYNVIKFNPKTAFHAVDYYDLEQTNKAITQTNSDIATLDLQNVKLTGSQTIAGIKTFTDSPTISRAEPMVRVIDTAITKGTAPSSIKYSFIGAIFDSTGTAQKNKMAQIYHTYTTSGGNYLTLSCFEPTSNSTDYAAIGVGYDSSKNVYTSAPTPGTISSTSNTNIATTGWCNDPSKSTNVVHRSGDETIDGIKTFSKKITRTAAFDNSGSDCTIMNDTNNKGYITNIAYYAGNAIYNRLLSRNSTANTQAYIDVTCNDSGNRAFNCSGGCDVAYAPTPSSATDNSVSIATTAWVRNHCCTTAATTTSTASKDAPAYVVENYRSGNSWYRVWSDGWIEQGGRIGSIPLNGTGSQNFHKAFVTANYSLQLTAGNDQSSSGFDTGTQGCAVYTKLNTTNFKWRMYHFGNQYFATQISWYACGY